MWSKQPSALPGRTANPFARRSTDQTEQRVLTLGLRRRTGRTASERLVAVIFDLAASATPTVVDVTVTPPTISARNRRRHAEDIAVATGPASIRR
jgi:hypothetical protein